MKKLFLIISFVFLVSGCAAGWPHRHEGQDYTMTSDQIDYLEKVSKDINRIKINALNKRKPASEAHEEVCNTLLKYIYQAPESSNFTPASEVLKRDCVVNGCGNCS